MAKLTHEEFDRQVEEAQKPPSDQTGGNFAPGVQQLRQAAGKRRQLTPAPSRPIPAA